MALPIKDQLNALLQDSVKTPQLILEVEGLPPFSSVPAQKYAFYGDDIVYGQAGLTYGGLIKDDRILPYINISKSTNMITQQLLTDKGGFSSTSNFDVAIVDKDQVISEMVSPGFVINDILGVKAQLYLALEGAGHPQDSVLFFTGIVTDVNSNAGMIKLSIGSPEKLKNQELFNKLSTESTVTISSVATSINALDTRGFILPADSGTLRSFIKVDDEIIEFTSKTDTSFSGLSRAQFGTIAATHQIGANVETYYMLTGGLKDLSLKLMLSGPNQYYASNIPIVAFNSYGFYNVPSAVFLPKYNIDQTLGVVTGDSVLIAGSISNNGTYVISQIVNIDVGSYLILNGTLNNEIPQGTLSIKSKYNVLPAGAGLEMTPDQVDVAQFEKVHSQFQATFFNYKFYIKDQINGSDFINTQLLYPSGAYAIPRKAKTSVGLTIPPLAQSGTVKLDESNLAGASKIAIKRSISKNFFNAVIYKYDPDAVEDKFLRGKITQSADSTNRIKISNKPMVIEAEGVRQEAGFQFIFDTQARRFLERYQFAAEYLEVELLFGVGFKIEIGDTVILDGRNLEMTDSNNGTRVFQPRLFEVQNKAFSLSGKTVKLSLVDTIYSLNGRYGTILPSSILRSGSTTSEIKLQRSFGTTLNDNSETVKWEPYVREQVIFRNDNWTYQEKTFITAINPADPNSVLLDPPLSAPPAAGLIMEAPPYDDTSSEAMSLYKVVGTFNDKSVPIVTGVNGLSFTVSASDALWFQPGFPVRIHNVNHTRRSIETIVDTVIGTTITVKKDLTLTPQLGDSCQLLGFKDGGKAYRYL